MSRLRPYIRSPPSQPQIIVNGNRSSADSCFAYVDRSGGPADEARRPRPKGDESPLDLNKIVTPGRKQRGMLDTLALRL
jgi:hypothetical protein